MTILSKRHTVFTIIQAGIWHVACSLRHDESDYLEPAEKSADFTTNCYCWRSNTERIPDVQQWYAWNSWKGLGSKERCLNGDGNVASCLQECKSHKFAQLQLGAPPSAKRKTDHVKFQCGEDGESAECFIVDLWSNRMQECNVTTVDFVPKDTHGKPFKPTCCVKSWGSITDTGATSEEEPTYCTTPGTGFTYLSMMMSTSGHCCSLELSRMCFNEDGREKDAIDECGASDYSTNPVVTLSQDSEQICERLKNLAVKARVIAKQKRLERHCCVDTFGIWTNDYCIAQGGCGGRDHAFEDGFSSSVGFRCPASGKPSACKDRSLPHCEGNASYESSVAAYNTNAEKLTWCGNDALGKHNRLRDTLQANLQREKTDRLRHDESGNGRDLAARLSHDVKLLGWKPSDIPEELWGWWVLVPEGEYRVHPENYISGFTMDTDLTPYQNTSYADYERMRIQQQRARQYREEQEARAAQRMHMKVSQFNRESAEIEAAQRRNDAMNQRRYRNMLESSKLRNANRDYNAEIWWENKRSEEAAYAKRYNRRTKEELDRAYPGTKSSGKWEGNYG